MTQAWSVQTGNEIVSTAAIGPGNTIYQTSTDGRLRALSPGGASNWTFTTLGQISASPIIATNGNIIIASYEEASRSSRLYSVRPDGSSFAWSRTIPGRVISSPALSADGRLYVVEFNNSQLLCFDSLTGFPLWPGPFLPPGTDTPGELTFLSTSPVIGTDGTVYVGSFNHMLYALRPTDGAILWRFRTGGPIRSAPAIDLDGTLYFTSSRPDDHLYAVNPDGTEKWRFRLPQTGELPSSPVIGPDGSIYCAAMANFFSVDRSGRLIWSVPTDGLVWSSPAIAEDGTVYFGTLRGVFYALNSSNVVARFSLQQGGQVTALFNASPTIVPDGQGTVLIGASDGLLRALRGPRLSSLASSPWPKARGSLQQTAQAPYHIRITSPIDGRTFKVPGQIKLAATAYALDGVREVRFRTLATNIVTLSTAPYEFLWTNVPLTTNTLKAELITSNAVNRTSYPVTFKVTEQGNLPFIETIPDQEIRKDAQLVVTFRAEDALNPASPLTITASAANTTLIPTDRISVTKIGSSYQLLLSPARGLVGQTTISIVATSAPGTDGGIATNKFELNVVDFNYPPEISPIIVNQAVVADGRVVIPEDTTALIEQVVVYDPEDKGNNAVSVTSSDDFLLPNDAQSIQVRPIGGVGSGFYQILLVPSTNSYGTTTVTITAFDTGGASSTANFILVVTPVKDPPELLTPISPQTVQAGAELPVVFDIKTIDIAPQNVEIRPRASDRELIPDSAFSLQQANSRFTLRVRPPATNLLTTNITTTVVLRYVDRTDPFQSINPLGTFQLTVTPAPLAPVIIEHPTNQVVAVTANIEIKATALGTEPLAYQWKFNGLPISPAANPWALTPTLQIFNATTSASGRYSVTVTNIGGSVTSSEALIEVVEPPTIVNAPPTNIVRLVGANLTLRVDATSTKPMVFYWLLARTNAPVIRIPGADTNVLTLNNLQLTNSGLYTCIVSNIAGAWRPTSTTLRVVAPPIITPGTGISVQEDTPFTSLQAFSVADADTPNALLLTSVRSLTPSIINNVSVQLINKQGLLTGRPLTNAFGPAQLEVTVRDDSANITTNILTLNVTAINDTPTLNPIPDQFTSEGQPLAVALSGISGGATNEPEIVSITATSSDTALVNVTVNHAPGATTGSLILTPAANKGGQATITVTATESGTSPALSITRTFAISIASVDLPPSITGLPASVVVFEDTPLEIPFQVNDDKTQFSALEVRASALGSLLAATNINRGDYNFGLLLTPLQRDVVSSTPIQIAVSASDKVNPTVFKMLTATIQPVNDPPTLNPIDPLTVTQRAPLQTVALSGITSGAANESQLLTVSVAVDRPELFSLITPDYTSPQTTGTLRFQPLPTAIGEARITVTVNDGGASNNITSQDLIVTITDINDPPIISGLPAAITLLEDSVTNIIFQALDEETTAANLRMEHQILAPSNTNLFPQGSVSLFLGEHDRTLLIRPATNQFGTATITVLAIDAQGLVARRDLNVQVLPVDDSPTAVSQNISTSEDSAVTFTLTASDPDTAPDQLRFTLFTDPLHGVLNANGLPTITYRPSSNYFGPDVLSFVVTDGNTTTLPTPINITVTPINDPPTISEIPNQEVSIGGFLSLTFTVSDPETNPDLLSVRATSNNQDFINDTSVTVGQSGSQRPLILTTSGTQSDVAQITVIVSDGDLSDSTTFLVSSLSEPPKIQPISDQTAKVGDTVSFQALVTGTPTPTVTWNVIYQGKSTTTNGTSLILQDVKEGQYQITAIANNGQGQPAIEAASLHVLEPPRITTAPTNVTVRAGAQARFSVQAAGSAPLSYEWTFDGGQTISSATNNTLLIASARPQDAGLYTVKVMNPAGSVTQSVRLTILSAPSLLPIGSQITDEDIPITDLALVVSDPDTPFEQLTLSLLSDNSTLIPTNNLTFGPGTTNRSFTITPAANRSGSASITIAVSDGVSQDSTTFRVDVRPINDPPTLSVPADVTFAEDTSSSPIPITLSDPDSDLNLIQLALSSEDDALLPLSGLRPSGSGGNRTLTITPTSQRSGTTTVVITARDLEGQSTTHRLRVVVTPVNDAPTISRLNDLAVSEGASIPEISLIVDDIDTPITQLRVTPSTSNPQLLPSANITVTGDSPQRILSLRPVPGQVGSADITLTVSDGALTASTTFKLTVAAQTLQITQQPVGGTITNGASFTFTVVATGTPPLTYQWFHEDEAIPGATQPSLSLEDATTDMTGSYKVVIVGPGGASITSDAAFLLVQNARIPSIVILSPANGAEFTAGAAIPILVKAFDLDGFVAQVQFYADQTNALGIATTEPFNFSWADAPIGEFRLTARVTDDSGLSAISLPVRVKVIQPPFDLPAIFITDATANEGNSTNPADRTLFKFTLDLFPASTLPVTVRYATADGTARAGTDYDAKSGELTFAPGTDSLDLVIPVIPDLTPESATENFFVNLLSASNAVLGDFQGEGIIVSDEELIELSFLSERVSVREGDAGTTNATFTVRLSRAHSEFVSVNYATVDESAIADIDYVLTSGRLQIPPGQLTATIQVPVRGNRTVDPPIRTFRLRLTGEVNVLLPRPPGGGDYTALGEIVDDDVLTSITVIPPAPFPESNANRTVPLTLRLSEAARAPIGIRWNTTNGTAEAGLDFVGVENATATIPVGAIESTIDISIRGDTIREADETFAVRLSLVDAATATLSTNRVLLTILNDDPIPTLTIDPVGSLREGIAGVAPTNLTLRLSNPTDLPVTLIATTLNGSAAAGQDYVGFTNRPVSIEPLLLFQTVDLGILGDTLDEDDETFVVRFDTIQNAVPSTNQVVLAIADDDPLPNLLISGSLVREGDSGTSNRVGLAVQLSRPSGRSVSVTYATVNGTASAGTDYLPASGTLTIPAGARTNLLFVTILGDDLDETNEVFTVRLSNPVNGSLRAEDAVAIVTVQDDDVGTITDNPPTLSTPASLNFPEDTTGQLAFTVTDDVTPSASLVVSADALNSTLLPANRILIQGTGANRTLALTPATNLFGSTDLWIRATDGRGNTVSNRVAVTVTPVNDPPTISPIPDQASDGVNAIPPITVTLADIDSPADQLVLTGTSDNTSILPNAGIVISGTGTNRTLRLNVNMAQTGVSLVTLTVSDGQASSQTTLSVGVRVVPPKILTNPADQSALAGSTVTLRVVASGTPPLQYQWSFNGVEIPGATQSTLVLSNVQAAAAGAYAVLVRNVAGAGSSTPGVLTVVGLPIISIRDVEANEGSGTATNGLTFNLLLSRASEQTVTVNYATENETALAGSDFVPRTGTVTFRSGERAQSVRIDLIPDDRAEPTETFALVLRDPVGATLNPDRARGTILNDDAGTLLQVSIELAASGAVTLKVQGDASRTYTVESSENLVNWSVFRADVASGAAVALLPSPRPQFYRAVAQP